MLVATRMTDADALSTSCLQVGNSDRRDCALQRPPPGRIGNVDRRECAVLRRRPPGRKRPPPTETERCERGNGVYEATERERCEEEDPEGPSALSSEIMGSIERRPHHPFPVLQREIELSTVRPYTGLSRLSHGSVLYHWVLPK